MYETQITPKKRPDNAVSNMSIQKHVNDAVDVNNDHVDNLANEKFSEFSNRGHQSPLHLPTTEPEAAKMDFSKLESMRLGFSWLQNSHSNQRDVMRSTPKKSQNSNNCVLNPFESDLVETMQMSLCSPSVFAKVVTPSKVENEGGTFNWGVENAAILYPKDFDEMSNQTTSMVDQEMEDKLQSAINTYFTQKIFVPSPWVANTIRDVNRSLMSSDDNLSEQDVPIKRSVSSQTALTIPINVDLSAILGQYFTFNDDQECSEDYGRDALSISNPRRKLFLDGKFQEELIIAESMDSNTQNKNCSMEPVHSTFFDTFDARPQHDELLSDRFQRATSVSPPPHIKTPTDSPIRPLSDDVSSTSSKTKESDFSLLSLCTLENETKISQIHDHSDDDMFNGKSCQDALNSQGFSMCCNLGSSSESTLGKMERDTGYQTEATISTISTSKQSFLLFNNSAQAPLPLMQYTYKGSSTNTKSSELPNQENELLVPNGFSKMSTSSVDMTQGDTSWSPSAFSTPSKHKANPLS